jgi:heme/copper-type cytochrome/quinol oxidase subunit 1
LLGMPRRVWTYLPNQGLDTMNVISSIGAFMMGIGTIVFVINVIITWLKPRNAAADAWEDGRTLEWTIPSPPPEYNFKQTPLVRGIDAWWKEKMDGNTEMTPAEPVGPIHMPSPTLLPLIMSIGLFIAGFGFMHHLWWLAIVGILITFTCMFFRSVFDDHGYHVDPEEEVLS